MKTLTRRAVAGLRVSAAALASRPLLLPSRTRVLPQPPPQPEADRLGPGPSHPSCVLFYLISRTGRRGERCAATGLVPLSETPFERAPAHFENDKRLTVKCRVASGGISGGDPFF
eukprot:560952-Rhodomonas_salina.2